MYKLIDSYDDAFIASTSQDPTDLNSAWDTQTASDDIFIQGLKQAIAGANLQSKPVTITQNGTTNVTPDTGYDGLSDVAITVNVSGGASS